MMLGIDRLLNEPALQARLKHQRVALLAHPASLTSDFRPTIDALMDCPNIQLVSCFGPQHGLRGDKQDNMEETADSMDHRHQIPVFSLYGKVRRPTPAMLETFDVLLVDIQDVGCRIYTFITTLFYLLEDLADCDKEVWVLDRPNPAGRVIEGLLLEPGQESFVGAAPIPMRHGLTLGEAAQWYQHHRSLALKLTVIALQGYSMDAAPGYGWPQEQLCWVNPSPNIATLNAVRAYPGTVLLEGTTLSEGRGTTRPLEQFGAPNLDIPNILRQMYELAPQWMQGVRLREVWFEPTFHKYQGVLCAGLHLHTDYPEYKPDDFKPFRLLALFLKSIRLLYPAYPLWRDFPYEYEFDRLAFDVINGGDFLRNWIDRAEATVEALETRLQADETHWKQQASGFYLYD